MCYISCLYQDHQGDCYLSREKRKSLCPEINGGEKKEDKNEKNNFSSVKKKSNILKKVDKENINFDVPF